MSNVQKKALQIKEKRMSELAELLKIHRELVGSFSVKVNRHIINHWLTGHTAIGRFTSSIG